MTTQTPLTDKATWIARRSADWHITADRTVVDADFARSLERILRDVLTHNYRVGLVARDPNGARVLSIEGFIRTELARIEREYTQ